MDSNKLAKLDNGAADEFLNLAEELGISLSSEPTYETNNSLYTNYIQPEGVRTLIEMHKTDAFRWNVPGEKKEFVEELYYKSSDGQLQPWGDIKELGGIIVDYSQRDQLGYYDGEKQVNICQVIGYGLPNNPVKDLPKVPYGNKYNWAVVPKGEKARMDKESPNPIVEKLGLVGMRGNRPTSCAECIKCGMSTEEVTVLEKGEEKLKTIECSPKGKLHLAVYEFTRISLRRVKGGDPQEVKETKHVNELYTLNEEGEGVPLDGPVLIQLNVAKSSIQGAYVKDDPAASSIGVEKYFTNLERTYKGANTRKNPLFNFTLVRLKKSPWANTYQTHFESTGMPSTEMIREANALWKSSVPVRSIVSMEIPRSIAAIAPVVEDDYEIEVHSSPSLKSAQPSELETEVEVVDENIPDLPF